MWWVRTDSKMARRPERLTEAYEVRAFRDEEEPTYLSEQFFPEAPHPEPGALQVAKGRILGHGEQTVIPDDCQFGDNDMCFVDS